MPARWLGIREGLRPQAATDRERLHARIDRSRQARLLWVVGEDGLGKSTLLATYVASRARPCLWLDLCPEDADPGFLFSHIVECARGPRTPQPMAAPHSRDVLGFARRFFTQLLAGLPADTMIVLDGCENAATGTLFPLILREALAVTPSGVQWCLLNGGAPYEDLAYLVTLFEGDRIGPGELLVDAEEAAVFLSPVRRRDPEAAARLARACGGCVVALTLMLAGSDEDAQCSETDFAGDPGAGLAGAARAFLSRQSETVRDALIALALPEIITADMLEALLRDAPVLRLLRAWMRRDLVLQTTAEGWRMQPAIRALVLELSRTQWNGGRRRDLLYFLARHCERRGRVPEAIRLYALVEEWGAVGGLVQREAESEIAAGRWTRVRDWIESLPDEFIERMPMLRFWLGRALLARDGELARLCFRRSRLQFDRTGSAVGQALSIAGILEAELRPDGDQEQIATLVTELDVLLELAPRFPSRVLEASVLRALVSAALWSATAPGGLAARTRRLHELLGAVELGADARLECARCLLEFYVVSGHPDLAGHLVALAGSEALLGGAAGPARAAWLAAAALHVLLDGTLDAATQACDHAVLAAQQECLPECERSARLARALVQVAARRFGDAQEDLSALRALERPRDPGDAAGLTILSAVLARAHGNPAEALRQAREFMRLGARVMPRYQLLLWGVLAVDIEIALGDAVEATRVLAQLERRAQHFCHAPWRLATALLEAENLRRQDAGLACRQALARALALHRENPAWAPALRLMAGTLAGLLDHALAQGIDPAQAERLIAQLDLEAPSRTTPDWPWRARLRVLGGLTASLSPASCRLLGALIAAGADGVAERELAALLHPQERGLKARTATRRALARMRKQLGEGHLLRHAGARWWLNAGHCWVDAWAFDELAGRDPARALALYRGRVLPAVDGTLLDALRTRLHGRYVETVSAYGQHFELEGRHEAALALYRAALEIDAACEVFYQGVMRCELQLGQVARARAAYDQLAGLLGRQAGEAPSSATQALLERLHAHERAREAAPDARPLAGGDE